MKTPDKLNIERTELREFTAGVRADAARSLELLRDIESTLTWLERLSGNLHTDAVFAEKMNTGLSSVIGVIDPDASIQEALAQTQEDVSALYDLLIAKRQNAREDCQLTEEDGIEEAFTAAIAQAADLHNAINSLRWNIGEHDVDASPKQLSKAYSADAIDEMFDDMLSS